MFREIWGQRDTGQLVRELFISYVYTHGVLIKSEFDMIF